MQDTRTFSRTWTIIGLAVALFGLPLVVLLFRLLAADPSATATIAVREACLFALAAALLWIVRRKERLPLSSIGLGRHGAMPTLGWGLAGLVAQMIGLAACMGAFAALGIGHGSGGGAIAPSMAATLLTVIRAGTLEELFYRGYAIERLEALTGRRWIAAVFPLLCFACFHYRQGMTGIVIALVMGSTLTMLYMWKRNLKANMIAHFLVDFLPNILLPLLGGY